MLNFALYEEICGKKSNQRHHWTLLVVPFQHARWMCTKGAKKMWQRIVGWTRKRWLRLCKNLAWLEIKLLECHPARRYISHSSCICWTCQCALLSRCMPLENFMCLVFIVMLDACFEKCCFVHGIILDDFHFIPVWKLSPLNYYFFHFESINLLTIEVQSPTIQIHQRYFVLNPCNCSPAVLWLFLIFTFCKVINKADFGC